MEESTQLSMPAPVSGVGQRLGQQDEKMESKDPSISIIAEALAYGVGKYQPEGNLENNKSICDAMCETILGRKVKLNSEDITRLSLSMYCLNKQKSVPGYRFHSKMEEHGWFNSDFFGLYLRCLIEAYLIAVSKQDKSLAGYLESEIGVLYRTDFSEFHRKEWFKKQSVPQPTKILKHREYLEEMLWRIKASGDNFLYAAGVPGHCLYIQYWYNGDDLFAAIYNLGQGLNFHKNVVLPNVNFQGKEVKVVFPLVMKIENSQEHLECIISCLECQKNGSNDAEIEKIYQSGTVVGYLTAAIEIAQISGNCVVKNYLCAMLGRIGAENFEKIFMSSMSVVESYKAYFDKGVPSQADIEQNLDHLSKVYLTRLGERTPYYLFGRSRDFKNEGGLSRTGIGSDTDLEGVAACVSVLTGLLVSHLIIKALKKQEMKKWQKTLLSGVGGVVAGGVAYKATYSIARSIRENVNPEGERTVVRTFGGARKLSPTLSAPALFSTVPDRVPQPVVRNQSSTRGADYSPYTPELAEESVRQRRVAHVPSRSNVGTRNERSRGGTSSGVRRPPSVRNTDSLVSNMPLDRRRRQDPKVVATSRLDKTAFRQNAVDSEAVSGVERAAVIDEPSPQLNMASRTKSSAAIRGSDQSLLAKPSVKPARSPSGVSSSSAFFQPDKSLTADARDKKRVPARDAQNPERELAKLKKDRKGLLRTLEKIDARIAELEQRSPSVDIGL